LLLGNGVNAGVTLRKSYAADAGWMVIAAGWALAVLCGVLVAQAFGSPGATHQPSHHAGCRGQQRRLLAILYFWSAQLLGAMAGASLVTLHYGPHWKLTPDPAAKLGVFCTNAAVRSPLFNIFSEPWALLCWSSWPRPLARMAFSHRSRAGPCSVACGQPGLGHRALARRHHGLRHQPRARSWVRAWFIGCLPIPGKGGSNWRYAPIPIIGDLAGAALAGLLLHYAHICFDSATVSCTIRSRSLRLSSVICNLSLPGSLQKRSHHRQRGNGRRLRAQNPRPSDTARHPFASNSASSSGAHPPSGPMAISSVGISGPACDTASSTALPAAS
jgi:glycerol uptake facilitator protein